MSEMDQILDFSELARQEGRRFSSRREVFHSVVKARGRHFIGIVGPRGAGKTVVLKQLAAGNDKAVYISADSIEDLDLFGTARALSEKYNCSMLLVDEIHHLRNFPMQLKKIYDFLDIRVVFTSSVSLSLYESAHDLARRVSMFSILPFSFGEFVWFKKGQRLDPLSIREIYDGGWTSEHMRCGHLFEEYLRGGILPYALEEPDPAELLRNSLHKIIYSDIPAVAKLCTDELFLLDKTVKFIAKSPVDGINYSSISRNIGITKYKAEAYLGLLQKAFVLNVVFPAGTNVLKEPKVLMCPPYRLLYSSYQDCIGALREDFFVETIKMRKLDLNYLKTNRGQKTPDYLIHEDGYATVIEVGGRNKGHSQFKNVSCKRRMILVHSDSSDETRKPLFMAGYI